jgi:hypothetical protein
MKPIGWIPWTTHQMMMIAFGGLRDTLEDLSYPFIAPTTCLCRLEHCNLGIDILLGLGFGGGGGVDLIDTWHFLMGRILD